MRIITVSREFGSGGREVAKRLADELGFEYYDKEIVTEIAKRCELDEGYVRNTLERSIAHTYPIHIGRSYSHVAAAMNVDVTNIFAEQTKLIKELAQKGNCVIVGRAADVLLKEYSPFNLFVYANMKSKIDRCLARAPEGEDLTRRETEKMIKKIDSERKKIHTLISDIKWGDKSAYHLCINTSGVEIKSLVGAVATFANAWFEANNL